MSGCLVPDKASTEAGESLENKIYHLLSLSVGVEEQSEKAPWGFLVIASCKMLSIPFSPSKKTTILNVLLFITEFIAIVQTQMMFYIICK